jgi:hypothetical protein
MRLVKQSNTTNGTDPRLVTEYQNLAKQSNGRISWNESTNSFNPYLLNHEVRYQAIQKEKKGVHKFIDKALYWISKLVAVQGVKDLRHEHYDSITILDKQTALRKQYPDRLEQVMPLTHLLKDMERKQLVPLVHVIVVAIIIAVLGIPFIQGRSLSSVYLNPPLRGLQPLSLQQYAYSEEECPICLHRIRDHPPGVQEGSLSTPYSGRPVLHCAADTPFHQECLERNFELSGARGYIEHSQCPLCRQPMVSKQSLARVKTLARTSSSLRRGGYEALAQDDQGDQGIELTAHPHND